VHTIQPGQFAEVADVEFAGGVPERAAMRPLRRFPVWGLRAAALFGVLALLACASPSGRSQQSFSTPQEAAHAFLDALARNDASSLARIFGIENQKRIASASWNANPEARARLTRSAHDIYAIRDISANEAQLVIGVDRKPFPVPILMDEKGWYFDASRGV
jgi:hypothetical protein